MDPHVADPPAAFAPADPPDRTPHAPPAEHLGPNRPQAIGVYVGLGPTFYTAAGGTGTIVELRGETIQHERMLGPVGAFSLQMLTDGRAGYAASLEGGGRLIVAPLHHVSPYAAVSLGTSLELSSTLSFGLTGSGGLGSIVDLADGVSLDVSLRARVWSTPPGNRSPLVGTTVQVGALF